jgi:hypothetical protein
VLKKIDNGALCFAYLRRTFGIGPIVGSDVYHLHARAIEEKQILQV